MPPVQPPARILVTGVNGFIASHVAHTLLSRSYCARGTVRSLSKGSFLSDRFTAEFGPGKFELAVVPDLLAENAFDKALEGVSGVIHLATPATLEALDSELQISTAKVGTLNLLKAAAKVDQVRSVVVTGSFAAVMFSEKGQGEDVDETDWNVVSERVQIHGGTPEELKGLHAYLASKTAGEKVAWEYVEKQQPGYDLSFINPSLVWGPLIHEVKGPGSLSHSTAFVYQYLSGQKKAISGSDYFVDVKTVASLHVSALGLPSPPSRSPAHRRFLATSSASPFSYTEVCSVLRRLFPDAPVPQKDTEDKSFVPGETGGRVNCMRTREVFGLEDESGVIGGVGVGRSLEATLSDMGKDMKRLLGW